MLSEQSIYKSILMGGKKLCFGRQVLNLLIVGAFHCQKEKWQRTTAAESEILSKVQSTPPPPTTNCLCNIQHHFIHWCKCLMLKPCGSLKSYLILSSTLLLFAVLPVSFVYTDAKVILRMWIQDTIAEDIEYITFALS